MTTLPNLAKTRNKESTVLMLHSKSFVESRDERHLAKERTNERRMDGRSDDKTVVRAADMSRYVTDWRITVVMSRSDGTNERHELKQNKKERIHNHKRSDQASIN